MCSDTLASTYISASEFQSKTLAVAGLSCILRKPWHVSPLILPATHTRKWKFQTPYELCIFSLRMSCLQAATVGRKS